MADVDTARRVNKQQIAFLRAQLEAAYAEQKHLEELDTFTPLPHGVQTSLEQFTLRDLRDCALDHGTSRLSALCLQ